tara:strand:+ start:2278 stop:2838 length:561 start_codon:yes stop_codon:yes gene_type:complete
MRIISGKFKGKKIYLPNDKSTRPLKDLVKESIFNVISHSNEIQIKINNSNILDLFSGSGSFGLEAVSRGAKNVTFVENYQDVLDILEKNISKLDCQKQCQIIRKNCFEYLNTIEEDNQKYDLIFLDPPFKEKNINSIIEKIIEKSILKKNGIITIHRHKKDNVDLTNKINIFDTRFYGISKIIFAN